VVVSCRVAIRNAEGDDMLCGLVYMVLLYDLYFIVILYVVDLIGCGWCLAALISPICVVCICGYRFYCGSQLVAVGS